MASKFLFLDYDGVLHPGLAGTMVYLPRLQAFLHEHPSVQVVLSTSWRLTYSFESLRYAFEPALRDRVVGTTPALPEGTRAQRFAEIGIWLTRYAPVDAKWAALDDDATLFPPWCEELVLCESVRGLRPAQLQEVARKLDLHQAGSQ